MSKSDIRVDARHAAKTFKKEYGYSPEGVWSAPGRVNVIGEHVDYAGGICLPFAINRRTYCAAAKRDDGVIRLTSVLPESFKFSNWSGTLDEVGPGKPSSWPAYPAGVLWSMVQVADQLGIDTSDGVGMDCLFLSDVPLGAGLSSSAAIEVAMACAVMDLRGKGLQSLSDDRMDDVSQLIIECCIRAENDVVGASTGGLDQCASLRGEEEHVLALDMGQGTVRKVPFDLEGNRLALLVINTNAPHNLGDGQYGSRRAIVDRVMEGLDTAAPHREHHLVRQAVEWAGEQPEALSNAESREEWLELVAQRMRHIVTESRRTENLVKALQAGSLGDPQDRHAQSGLEKIGGILLASHESLRDDYEVSCPELDSAVDAAMDAGAWGARMTGGGFGGSAIALINQKDVDRVKEAVSAAAQAAHLAAPSFLVAVPSAGARRDS